mgnify:FL=1
MLKLGDLFVLQLLYNHFEEFEESQFSMSFQKYFGCAKNKEDIKEMLIKYLFDIKFTKDELRQLIAIKKSRMDSEDLEQNKLEWNQYNISEYNNKKARY